MTAINPNGISVKIFDSLLRQQAVVLFIVLKYPTS